MRVFLALFVTLVLTPATAVGFCGFFVAPEGAEQPVNHATRVALLRHHDTTIMSLQPDYRGTAKDFAMVLPVPEILDKRHVRTLSHSVFDELEKFSAPRMSEYWEQDPCNPHSRSPRRNGTKTKFYSFESDSVDGKMKSRPGYIS